MVGKGQKHRDVPILNVVKDAIDEYMKLVKDDENPDCMEYWMKLCDYYSDYVRRYNNESPRESIHLSDIDVDFNKTENLKEFEKFDIILNLEIVEHVADVNLYIESCHKLLKKNGLMFTATINRTFISYLKAIIGAEYILRWLPIGTHDWNKFLKPEELEQYLNKNNFQTIDVKGLEFNPISRKWKRSDNLSVNYIICSTKT